MLFSFNTPSTMYLINNWDEWGVAFPKTIDQEKIFMLAEVFKQSDFLWSLIPLALTEQ